MHLTSGAARQVYENLCPDRRIPQHQRFAQVYCNLCEHGSLRNNLHDTGRRQLTRTFNAEERILQSFEDNPNTSTRDIVQQYGVFQSKVWRIVQEYILAICKGCGF
ncbi:hypothetical protein TNIN_391731 [Trichonephila inaurata madagascariensis]|uniref:Uncharacterized protein n=1 Tax=Trichonephila inaurata madagascariensis TaxID=2747483 RepID=A0A8X6MLC5_9ARAC|nr:hypothetical protein TNIN_391731 [Trichonephila inaurata madagascariensis]